MGVSDRRVVILGKTGCGKSSLANTIFGEKPFKVDNTANSGTPACRAETRSVNGRNITLIDTPGFFDTNQPEKELKPEIVRCITECAPGPHAFLIVLKVEKFTEQEQAVIDRIDQYFSEEVFKYATVVFTYGDQLEEGEKIEDFVCQNESLRDLVRKCGGRCHVIDNKYWKNNQQDEYRSNKYQVEKILNTIDEITKANKRRCYTNEMLKEVEKEIQQEKELIRESSGNMSEEEITRQARGRVYNKIWIRLAGVGTGALLGALFGVVAIGGVVVLALKNAVPVVNIVAQAAAGAAGAGGTAAGAVAAGAVAAGETAAGAVAAGAVSAEAAAAAAGVAGAAAGGGTAAAAAGGAAVAGGLGATGIAMITIAGVSAAAGAAVGGYAGYHAAEGAETPQEAAKMAAAAVKEGAQSIVDGVSDRLNVSSKSTYLRVKSCDS